MFGIYTGAKVTKATTDRNINALLEGTQWTSPNVTFGFADSSSDYESSYRDPAYATGFRAFNLSQKTATRSWAAQYNSVSNLNLTETTGRDATLRMAVSSSPSTAYAYSPGNYVEAGDMFFNPNNYNSPTIGNYAYTTFGHEIGHALGLKHGQEVGGVANTALSADRDSMEFSIMTYRGYIGADFTTGYTNESGGYAQSLMMYDIRAVQEMYGANFTSNASNTIYSFSTTTGEMFVNGVGQGAPTANRIFRTIWDGNGNDTYDFSNYTTNLSVDLTPGGWSDLDTSGNFQAANLNAANTPSYSNGVIVGYYNDPAKNIYARGQVFNALQYNNDDRSLIENANGGSGNDRILGNNANNILRGNGGNDYLDAGNGNDYLDGGTGADTMVGGSGNDIYIVDNAGDIVTETSTLSTEIDTVRSSVSYTLVLNVEQLVLTGSAAINGTGNNLNNVIIGNSANNILVGGAGNDTLTGGLGADRFQFNSKNEGVDTINDFTNGIDKIVISAAGFGGSLVAGLALNSRQIFTVSSGLGSAATNSSQRFIYNSNTGGLFFDADGSGAGLSSQFATLSSNLKFSVADFAIV
jgi:serralysin